MKKTRQNEISFLPAGYTFCFVVVGVGVATFNQTWQYFS
jgi:hypothetical protein